MIERELEQLLGLVTIVAGAGLAGVLEVQKNDQKERDRERKVYAASFGRQVAATELLAWIRGLSSIPRPARGGHDSVAVEVVGSADGIRHLVRLPGPTASGLIRAMQAAIPALRLEPAAVLAYRPSGVRELIATHRYRPLRADRPEEVAAAILAALSSLGPDELVVWQWVISPARGSGQVHAADVAAAAGWLALVRQLWGMEPGKPDVFHTRAARAKSDEPLFIAAGRVGARARTAARTNELLSRVIRATGGLRAPGVWLTGHDAGPGGAARLETAATPVRSIPALLNAREVVAVLGVPIAGPMVPGVSYNGGRLLPPSSRVADRGRIIGDAIASGAERPVALSVRASLEHMIALAPTGGGKTTLLASLILQDISGGAAS